MSSIPIVASADDLPEAIRYGQLNPSSRWYVASRAQAFGRGDAIPTDWGGTPSLTASTDAEEEEIPSPDVVDDPDAPELTDDEMIDPLAASASLTTDERRKLAREGAAMSDGSYPIRNRSELHKAINLRGSGNADATKVVAHIRKRAKALGLEDDEKLQALTADAGGEQPEPIVAGVEKDLHHAFEDALHPRGRDGRWIQKGGRVQVVGADGKAELEGTVLSVDRSPTGVAEAKIKTDAGQTITAPAHSIQQAPVAEAHVGTPPTPGGAPSQEPIRLEGHDSVNLSTGEVTRRPKSEPSPSELKPGDRVTGPGGHPGTVRQNHEDGTHTVEYDRGRGIGGYGRSRPQDLTPTGEHAHSADLHAELTGLGARPKADSVQAVLNRTPADHPARAAMKAYVRDPGERTHHDMLEAAQHRPTPSTHPDTGTHPADHAPTDALAEHGQLYRDAQGHEVWRVRDSSGKVVQDGIASDHDAAKIAQEVHSTPTVSEHSHSRALVSQRLENHDYTAEHGAKGTQHHKYYESSVVAHPDNTASHVTSWGSTKGEGTRSFKVDEHSSVASAEAAHETKLAQKRKSGYENAGELSSNGRDMHEAATQQRSGSFVQNPADAAAAHRSAQITAVADEGVAQKRKAEPPEVAKHNAAVSAEPREVALHNSRVDHNAQAEADQARYNNRATEAEDHLSGLYNSDNAGYDEAASRAHELLHNNPSVSGEEAAHTAHAERVNDGQLAQELHNSEPGSAARRVYTQEAANRGLSVGEANGTGRVHAVAPDTTGRSDTPRADQVAARDNHELHGVANSAVNKGALSGDEAHGRVNAILSNPNHEAAHRDLAKLMSEAKLGGKQRARYREVLNQHHGSSGTGMPAGTLRDDNPLKQRLADAQAKALGGHPDTGVHPADVKGPRQPTAGEMQRLRTLQQRINRASEPGASAQTRTGAQKAQEEYSQISDRLRKGLPPLERKPAELERLAVPGGEVKKTFTRIRSAYGANQFGSHDPNVEGFRRGLLSRYTGDRAHQADAASNALDTHLANGGNLDNFAAKFQPTREKLDDQYAKTLGGKEDYWRGFSGPSGRLMGSDPQAQREARQAYDRGWEESGPSEALRRANQTLDYHQNTADAKAAFERAQTHELAADRATTFSDKAHHLEQAATHRDTAAHFAYQAGDLEGQRIHRSTAARQRNEAQSYASRINPYTGKGEPLSDAQVNQAVQTGEQVRMNAAASKASREAHAAETRAAYADLNAQGPAYRDAAMSHDEAARAWEQAGASDRARLHRQRSEELQKEATAADRGAHQARQGTAVPVPDYAGRSDAEVNAATKQYPAGTLPGDAARAEQARRTTPGGSGGVEDKALMYEHQRAAKLARDSRVPSSAQSAQRRADQHATELRSRGYEQGPGGTWQKKVSELSDSELRKLAKGSGPRAQRAKTELASRGKA